MSLPHAVIFDNDGLLLDTESVWTRAERNLYRLHGRDFTSGDKRELVGTSAEVAAVFLERRLGEPGHVLIDQLQALVTAELEHGVEAMRGAVGLIEALRLAGTPVGVVSNSRRVFVLRALDLAGLGDSFDVVVSAEEVSAPKPAPDPYLEACSRLGVDPGLDVVALEDSPTGALAARTAGLWVVGIPSFPGVEVPEAHLQVRSLEDPGLRELLLGK